MGMLAGLTDWLLKAVTSRRGGRRAMSQFLVQGSNIGLYNNSWTESRYEQVRHFKHWVYVAVDRIATEVAMHMPNVSLVRGGAEPIDDEKRLRCLPLAARLKALTPLNSHEELEPVKPGHPLRRLLLDPNEPDTGYDLWYETVLFLLLTGNAYWWLPPDGVTGKPAAIWVLPSHWVFSNVGKGGHLDTYEVRPVEGNYLRMSIPAGDVLHFKRKSPVSKIDGAAPLGAGAQWVDTQESIDRTRWFSFRNGVFPGVAVSFDPKMDFPDADQLDRIEAKFMGRYAGEIQANKPLFVPPGMKVNKLSVSPHEMDFTGSAGQIRDQILALFGVPATVAQVNSDMTYGSVSAARASYYMSTINPLFHFFGQHTTEKLAARWDRRLRVWWEDRTPQDPELYERALQTDLSYGVKTINEVRSLRGQEPYPQDWANEPWLPLNTVPASQAVRLAELGAGSRGANSATQRHPQNTPSTQE